MSAGRLEVQITKECSDTALELRTANQAISKMHLSLSENEEYERNSDIHCYTKRRALANTVK